MSVEPEERNVLGVAATTGAVAACAACCAPPVIGLLGIGAGAAAVFSTALFVGVGVGLLVAVLLGGLYVVRRHLGAARSAHLGTPDSPAPPMAGPSSPTGKARDALADRLSPDTVDRT